MLAQNTRKIFDDLKDNDIRILGIVASIGRATPYDVWKETKNIGEEIPQRTVYGKIKWLSKQSNGYLAITERKDFKRVKEKVYYEVTLKGALAALGNEKVSLLKAVLERLRMKLHIPEECKGAVRPIALLWAYRESRMPKHLRGKIDEGSVMISVWETYAACQGVGVFSALCKDLDIPEGTRTLLELDSFLKEKFGIASDEHVALKMFFSKTLHLMSSTFELHKRTLEFAEYLTPSSYLSDSIEILPNFAIRVFLGPFKQAKTGTYPKIEIDMLRWMNMHERIADLVSKGNEEDLYNYISESLLTLQLFCLPICFSRHLDGTCGILEVRCPHDSPLKCELIRKNAEKYKKYIEGIIGRLMMQNKL